MNITTWRFNIIGMLLCCLMVSMSAQATGYTITTGTNGSGTVTRNPSNSLYPANATVVVTATPAAGWYFSGWSGSIGDAINPTNIFVNGNFTITGIFLPQPTNTVTVVTNGSGSIALNPPGGSYASNTTVTATATPSAGWVFTGWSGAATGAVNPLPLGLVTNLTLTGTFAQLPAFDVQPQSTTNVTGSTVTFTSDSVGTAPVAYQWYFGGGPLTGATASSLSLSNVQATQAGSYSVVATNLYGAATSSVALLVVTNGGGSTNVVNTPTDAALRAAVAAGGWVSLTCNGTIALTNTITLTKNVILDASGVNLVISGGGSNRIFYVPAGITLAATNLTLANGVYVSSSAPADGGAIYNNGTVSLTGCTLTNNAACSSNAPGNSAFGTLTRGGAIFNNGGTVGLFMSSVSNNFALNKNTALIYPTMTYGGAIYTTNGTVIILSSTISSNFCQANLAPAGSICSGGALYQASGSTHVTNDLFNANLAQGLGGYSTYSPPAGCGGAIAISSGILVLDHCQVSGNRSRGGDSLHNPSATGQGGGIWNGGTLIVESTAIDGNATASGNYGYYDVPAQGGGLYNTGSALLNHADVCSNSATGGQGYGLNGQHNASGQDAFGGGIFNAGQLTATNCTIALNTAFGGPAWLTIGGQNANRGNAIGGGVFNASNSIFTGMNLTLASNVCNAAGTQFLPAYYPYGTNYPPISLASAELDGLMLGTQTVNTNGTVSLHNTLLAYGGTNANCYGPITDLGYNMNSDGSATFNSGYSYSYTDPQLTALANNGGPTLTMSPLASSPAIGFGDPAGAPATDQRGYYRTGVNGIDIGAYQSDGSSSLPPSIGTQPLRQTVMVGGTATFSVAASGATPLSFQWQLASTNLPGATNATLTLTNVQSGQAGYYSVLVTNAIGSAQSATARLTVTGPALTGGLNGTNLQINFAALPATTYHLQTTTNLSAGWTDWQIIGPFGSSSNVTRPYPDTTHGPRFFRLWQP